MSADSVSKAGRRVTDMSQCQYLCPAGSGHDAVLMLEIRRVMQVETNVCAAIYRQATSRVLEAGLCQRVSPAHLFMALIG